VETRGVIDGDEIVITGQKVWTSGAAHANRMFLLCRPALAAAPDRR
jgi:alkylation response protein AidB-like acyl-CoA dehydrogenase